MSIQRRLHDIQGCRCIFVVRYDDDEVEVCPNAKILGASLGKFSESCLHCSTLNVFLFLFLFCSCTRKMFSWLPCAPGQNDGSSSSLWVQDQILHSTVYSVLLFMKKQTFFLHYVLLPLASKTRVGNKNQNQTKSLGMQIPDTTVFGSV